MNEDRKQLLATALADHVSAKTVNDQQVRVVRVVCVVCNGKKQVVTGHRAVCCMEGMPKSPAGEREQWLTRRCEECQPTYVPKLETCPQCRGTGLLLATVS